MLKRIEKIEIGSDSAVSRKLHDYFQRKYCLGACGVVGATVISSLFVKGIKPLSMMNISPSGQMKSQITNELASIFPDNSIMIPSRFTPYGLSRKMGKPKLDNKCWIVNDLVRTFDGMPQVKISEIVGWIAEMMSEGRSASMTYQDAELDARMNMLGNIALVSYKELERKFVSSTLNERIMQFGFYVDKNEVREKSEKNFSGNPHKIRLKLRPSVVNVSNEDRKKIRNLADSLQVIAHYERHSMRPDEMVQAFLVGHAKLNGRRSLSETDYNVFRQLFKYFEKVI